MAKVTVVTGPQGSGKTTEVNKLIAGRPAMQIGSLAVNGFSRDPFYIQHLIQEASAKKATVIVMPELWVEPALLRTMLNNVLLSGILFDDYPADVIIETQMPEQDIPFKSYIDLIVKTKPEKKNGLEIISEERQRQITDEGWTTEHDAQHRNGELAEAAACYAMGQEDRQHLDKCGLFFSRLWPWARAWWKPTPENRIRELAKAGALIAAEIDRILNLPKSNYNAKDN